MKTKPVHKWSPVAIMAAGLCISAAPADALPAVNPTPPERTTLVAGDCYAVGRRIAAQNGGTLAAARAVTRGGKPVCVVVVLIPGKNGQRPRRREIVVPL